MAKKKDLTGETYGRLKVIKEVPKEDRLGNSVTWECLCECGRIHKARTSNLVSHKTLSCGCIKSKNTRGLVGKVFGALTVTHNNGMRDGKSNMFWECVCECGRTSSVRAGDLLSGNTRSCGCHTTLYPRGLEGKTFGSLTVIERVEKNSSGKTLWECSCFCGNTLQVPTGHLISEHTSSCGCNKESKGERAIKQYLNQERIPYITEYTFEGLYYKSEKHLLRFDFGILGDNGELKTLIEYDGEQHFEPNDYFGGKEEYELTVARDKAKDEYCKRNKIPLIRIPYTEYKNITKILGGN